MDLDGLFHRGFAVFPSFLEGKTLSLLNKEFDLLWEKGQFSEAKVGKALEKKQEKSIRGDWTHWLDTNSPSAVAALLSPLLGELQEQCNRDFYLGIRDFEGHFALYPPGSHYDRHLDVFHKDSSRILSFVLYLNQTWETNWGGELCLYSNPPMKISPIGGTLVLFLSQELEHEVLPTRHERRSFTGWFTRSPSL